MADNEADGFEPVNVSVVVVGGQPFYTALYRDLPGTPDFEWEAVTVANYQTAVNQRLTMNQSPRYLSAYQTASGPVFSVIWGPLFPNGSFAQHGMSGPSYDSFNNSQVNAGSLTQFATGYQDSGSETFAAVWSPE
jgi:hypothetical protein